MTGLDPVKLGRLTTLEIRNNKLMSTNGMNLPKVKNLYLVSSKFYAVIQLTVEFVVPFVDELIWLLIKLVTIFARTAKNNTQGNYYIHLRGP